MVRIVITELTLEASLPLVDLTVHIATEANYLVEFVDLGDHLTSDGAVGACSGDLPTCLFPLVFTLHQRSSGTDIDACAAKLATRFHERRAVRSPD